MCYVGQVCKLCLFIVVLAVVGGVVFGFVWLSHEHHHHNSAQKCENDCSPPYPSGDGNYVPLAVPPPVSSTGNYVPLAVPPPVSSTRPFIAAASPFPNR